MSDMDDPSLEFFVEDSFMNISKEEEKKIVELLESEREWIEDRMDDWYDERPSWRDYRNSMWHSLEQYDERINKILGTPPEI